VRWIVGFAPGGMGDIIARPMDQWLSERLGQPVIIENRPGAAGNIATEAVVRAPADGYTLLLVNSGNAASAALYDKLNFLFPPRHRSSGRNYPRAPHHRGEFLDPGENRSRIDSICKGQSGQSQLCVRGQRNDQSYHRRIVQDDDRRQHGPRTLSRIRAALTAMLGRQVQVMFDNLLSSIEYVRTGKLRALAVTTATRLLLRPRGFGCSAFILW
jgi:hypothetical protein